MQRPIDTKGVFKSRKSKRYRQYVQRPIDTKGVIKIRKSKRYS